MFRKQYPFPNSETARSQYGGVKAVSLSARKICPRPGSGVYKAGARDSVYNPRICLSPLPLSSLALMFWERERKREIEDSGHWKLLANFQLQYKAQITFFPNLKFSNYFLNSFVAEEDSGKQRKKNPSGVLYVWQSSRWCWRAVSQWILLSIPLELFLLFSQSPFPFCRFPLVEGSVPLS
jgi:hypothetical protein